MVIRFLKGLEHIKRRQHFIRRDKAKLFTFDEDTALQCCSNSQLPSLQLISQGLHITLRWSPQQLHITLNGKISSPWFQLTHAAHNVALSKALYASTGPLWLHEMHRYYTARHITVLDTAGSKHGLQGINEVTKRGRIRPWTRLLTMKHWFTWYVHYLCTFVSFSTVALVITEMTRLRTKVFFLFTLLEFERVILFPSILILSYQQSNHTWTDLWNWILWFLLN